MIRQSSALVVLVLWLLPSLFASQQPSPSTLAEIQAIEDEWSTAIRTKDTSILERILGAEYSFFSVSDGTSEDRAAMIAGLKSSQMAWASVSNPVRSLQVHGDIAVARGEFIGTATENGKSVAYHDSWQTVFVKRGGRWIALASHEAPLPSRK